MQFVFEAQRALGLSQREFGELLESSQRTVQRWSAGRAEPYHHQLVKLAAAVYGRNPDLAHRLASSMGQTLESLGVVMATQPAASPIPSLLVEAVVSAAAEALDVSPRVARPAVLAAMERAKAASLSVDNLLAVLRAPASKREKG